LTNGFSKELENHRAADLFGSLFFYTAPPPRNAALNAPAVALGVTIGKLVAAALEPSDVPPPLPLPDAKHGVATDQSGFRLIVGRGGKGCK
jgi:hypothetical protein